jgi:hypothetical protein
LFAAIHTFSRPNALEVARFKAGQRKDEKTKKRLKDFHQKKT